MLSLLFKHVILYFGFSISKRQRNSQILNNSMIRGSRLRPYEDDTTLESTAWIFKGGKNKYDSQSKNQNYICQKYANSVVE